MIVAILALAVAAVPVEARLRTALPQGNDAARALRHLDLVASKLPRRQRAILVAQVAANLAEKERLATVQGSPLGLTERELEREVIDFEAFKLSTFLSSGVFPKRYFGYFDERWDTAALERELKEVVSTAVPLANREAAANGSGVRLTDEEVAVTFLAEGGALLLRERQAELAHILPVQDVGMDDVAAIFARHPKLLAALDRALGTHLATVTGGARILRTMTYREALAAVSVTWLDEKERAERLLDRAGGGELSKRSGDEQFVIGSLVYNSGQLFAARRVRMILGFETAGYLALVSRENATSRWPLPIAAPGEALAGLSTSGAYPDQPTSWSAVYHVLQRYGAFVALSWFTDNFDAGGRFLRALPRR